MSQSITTGFIQNIGLLQYYIILLGHNLTTLAITFTLCLLGRRIQKPGLREWSWAWEERRKIAPAFLSHCPIVLIFPKSGLPMTSWPLSSLPTNFLHAMLSFVLWERGRSSRCAAELRCAPQSPQGALSWFIRCQHREWIRRNTQWLNTSSKCWGNYDRIQALTLQTPKLRYNWGSFYLFKEGELVSSGGALFPKAEGCA